MKINVLFFLLSAFCSPIFLWGMDDPYYSQRLAGFIIKKSGLEREPDSLLETDEFLRKLYKHNANGSQPKNVSQKSEGLVEGPLRLGENSLLTAEDSGVEDYKVERAKSDFLDRENKRLKKENKRLEKEHIVHSAKLGIAWCEEQIRHLERARIKNARTLARLYPTGQLSEQTKLEYIREREVLSNGIHKLNSEISKVKEQLKQLEE